MPPATATATTADDLAARLRDVLGAEEVRDVRLRAGGAMRDTWSFVARFPGGGERALVVQRQRPGRDRDVGVEAAVRRAAFAAGVPVPEVLAHSTDPGPLGGPFLVSALVEGETLGRRILRDDRFARARERFAADCARALATLHETGPPAVPGLVATDELARCADGLAETGATNPVLELAVRWLDRNRPPAVAPRLLHGDFRLGNLIVGEDGLRAVVDWEATHLGDPVEDLGWLCLRSWRFGGPRPVAGIAAYDDLLGAYADASGAAVDPEVLRWWEVLAGLKWGVTCIRQYEAHRRGDRRSHELAVVGRRVCEAEYDIVSRLP